jgi:catechol 2,3-dioxygenase-like lactoylglutathione lyase family enzyme
MMTGITGAHILLNSAKPEADRAFFRDVLGFPGVDVGGGWLIFKLPTAEMAVHPSDGKPGKVHAGHALSGAVLYLMCDDLKVTIKALKAKKVKCTETSKERWGVKTTVQLPSGGEIGLYQPSHATALNLA